MENKNQPITATLTYDEHDGKPNGHLLGLTKREYFAVMAMQGICASGANDFNTDHVQRIAEIAVKQADALLSELSK